MITFQQAGIYIPSVSLGGFTFLSQLSAEFFLMD